MRALSLLFITLWFTNSLQSVLSADDLDSKIDAIAKQYLNNSANCGLSIATYKDKEVKFYNYGEVRRGSKQLPDNETIYEIGSVTKAFTGILLAQAVLEKKVSFNDDIRKYLPGEYENLEYQGKPIELIHLAAHTSGLPRLPANLDQQEDYNPLDPYKNYNMELLDECLKTIVLDILPGTKYGYSNLGSGLLGIILENVYSTSFEELVASYISDPLGLSSTKINLNEEENKRFALGYDALGFETPHWDLGVLAAAGGLHSTSADLITFVKENVEESNEAFKLSHQHVFDDGQNKTTIGWMWLTTYKGNEMIWKNGGTYGFSSFTGFVKSKDVGVVVLSNSGNLVDYVALEISDLLE